MSMREKPDAKAKVLEKIPYSEKLMVNLYADSLIEITTEGIAGKWVKVTYKGKTGYVVSSYLFPSPPPRQGVATLKAYLAQIAAVAGPAVTRKSAERMGEGDFVTTLTKQLYKNGAELHSYYAYEYNSDTYFLPEFSIEQGFLLMRLLGEYPDAASPSDALPAAKGKKKTKYGECSYEIERETYGPVKTLKYQWEEGGYFELIFSMMDGQLVISASGGV
jgi:Bacterial SH3 domain